MLEFLKVKNPQQIRNLLKNYNPQQNTWIVSDLKSKQEIQNECIQKYGFYTDDAILRVSDFWRLWVRRLEPTLQVVSSDFINSLVQHFVDTYATTLEILDSEVTTLNKAVQEFAPILLHPASDEVLQEWLESQKLIKKWQRWYQIAKVCLNYIVNEKKVIDSKWAASYLQSLDLKLISWDRKIFVDLGSELSSVEMGLFKHISQSQSVVMITPDPVWKEKFPYLLNTYKENYGFGKVSEFETEHSGNSFEPDHFVRLSTQLAEVKFAVSNVRQWADEGVALAKIAIISTEIEKYWPVLQLYLDAEGIRYKKDLVAQLNSLGDVQNLLASLKNYSEDVGWDSLEKTYFNKEVNLQYKYEKFKSLFYQLYDADDLARDQKIKNLFYKKINFNSDISRDDFLAFVVKTWVSLPSSLNKNEVFELIIKDFLGQSLDVKIKFNRWFQFLKNRLSHKEVIIKKKTEAGVQILPLMSAHMIEATHRIYLGLNDEFYHKRQTALMSLADSTDLRTQFDLAVDYTEESYLDFNLRWQSLAAGLKTFYTSAHLSFLAEPLNSSLFFIENSPVSKIINPGPTRMDELQNQYVSLEEISSENSVISASRLKEDRDGYKSKLKNNVFQSLNVSDVENYASCAFKLLASKGFRLRDLPQIGLDLDPRQKGSLVHALFEKIVNLMTLKTFEISTVSEFLESKRLEFNIYTDQEAYWSVQKNKLLQLASKFHKFEIQRLEIFSAKTELSAQVYFDIDQNEFTVAKPRSGFVFNIRIDRVDTHKTKKYSVIYDYKSSGYQVSNYNTWLSEHQYQMLLYIIAAQLCFQNDAPIAGALYYQFKNFDIKKGLIAEDIAISDFGLSKRNKSLIADDKLLDLKHEFIKNISEVLKSLSEFNFSNAPQDFETCKNCDWRKLCRAPHLM